MTPDDHEPFDDVVCLFCNSPIAEDEEALTVSLKAAWSDGVDGYWCHGRCLQEATHPAVPLYILSLSRDEAVFGRRQVGQLPTYEADTEAAVDAASARRCPRPAGHDNRLANG